MQSTQGKSTAAGRKEGKEEDLDFEARLLKLKLQLAGKEH